MKELLSIIDSGETLIDVVGLAHVDLPDQLAAIRFEFSTTMIYIEVDATDDSLNIRDSVPVKTTELRSLAAQEPWAGAIGNLVLWAWRLINHQGYSDGIQFAFSEGGTGIESVVLQLVGKASTVEVSRVSRVDQA